MAGVLDGDEDTVLQRLAAVQRALASIQRIDPSLSRLQETFDAAFYGLEELSRELVVYEEAIELDPERLAEVERRRDMIFRLTKKYGPAIADVLETAQRARAELDLVDSAAFDLRQLTERERLVQRVSKRRAPCQLRARQPRTASRERSIRCCPISNSRRQVHGRAYTASRDRPAGAEDVEFRVALNVGHDARPLARVASGGELSRVMLALKTILARLAHVPTLVFDEVDAGIGGRVGLQVGETMRRVAAHHQVFAISHLPQIAARAHHHILVAKGARRRNHRGHLRARRRRARAGDRTDAWR
jgi:DNA repair protein RecN (Recombination protein N)